MAVDEPVERHWLHWASVIGILQFLVCNGAASWHHLTLVSSVILAGLNLKLAIFISEALAKGGHPVATAILAPIIRESWRLAM